MKRPQVLIINRASVVKGAALSRSVEERLYEPLREIELKRWIDLSIENEMGELHLKAYTHLVFNRGHSAQSLTLALKAKALGLTVISDLDDLPIFLPDGDSAFLDDQKQKYFLEILKASDILVCSTPKIKEWADSHFAQKHNVVIPTGFDFERFDQQREIKFHGSQILFTNAGSLKLGNFGGDWLDTMTTWLKKNKWRLSIYADFIDYFPDEFPMVSHGSVPWVKHKLEINQNYSLAVVPLAASEDPKHLKYSIFKTPIKYIIYGGLGICGIYSKTPIYQNEIEDRVHGYLADNTRESWLDALDEAVNNKDLTKKIVTNAMSDVRQRYSKKIAIEGWKKVLELN